MLPRCICIGASAGGYEILRDIVSQLPADLRVPVFVVLHVPAYEPSQLPEILDESGALPAVHPEDGAEIRPGTIYVAPPDHHLLVDSNRVAVKRGPKENGFRPSIDALFRSAAYSYGPGAIGVILSGALHDGTSGLWSIKRLGGIAIVQDPYEARYPSMPRSALEYVEPDYILKSIDIPGLLSRLTREPIQQNTRLEDDKHEDVKRMAKEVQVAEGVNLPEEEILELGPLTPFTCPECRGVLVQISEGETFRFRCHTGHGFTAEALLAGAMEKNGELIWQTMRSFQESNMLLEHIGNHMQQMGETEQGQVLLDKARELNKRASSFQRVAMGHEILSIENLEPQQPTND